MLHPAFPNPEFSMNNSIDSKEKFEARAREYDQQSRIALAGYEACHELTACVLAAEINRRHDVTILAAGSGTAQEILCIGTLEPEWRYVAVDPSPTMNELAATRLKSAKLDGQTEIFNGYVQDLPADRLFDGATLIGVLHHLPSDAAKREVLGAIAARLEPKAPFVLACNRFAYASKPRFVNAWRQRWRMYGASEAEIEEKLGKILHGAQPPESEQAVIDYLQGAAFEGAELFFSSLFWSAWICRKA
jgi:tRNA (cmo5U34)-methyltransferase